MDTDISVDIKELESLIQSSISDTFPISSETTSNESPQLSIATSKVRQLQAEIATVKESPITTIIASNKCKHEILQTDIEQSIAHLQETLSFVRSQRKELADDIDRETETRHQLETVVEALKERLGHNEESDHDKSIPNLMRDLKKKKERVDKHCKEMKRSLTAFINEHFPLPSAEDISEAKSRLRSADNYSSAEYMISLKRILEDLINKSLDEPNDPYIEIDETFWPPYLELLLRCQIVIRHPDSENKIKLVPFHL